MRSMSRKLTLAVVLVAVGAGCFFGYQALAGHKVYVGQKCNDANRPSLARVDHSPFDALLQQFVDARGRVNYTAWKGDANSSAGLKKYLNQLGCVDLSKPASKSAQLAFWINAYNALTLEGILREYPTSSIRNHTAKLGYNIWKDLLLWVDGKYYSLDDIEHQILRKMGEPRIHFALVCASKGCPPLVNRAYTAQNLETLLVYNAKRFFADPQNLRVDNGNRTIHISSLLEWYGTDFAKSPQQQIQILLPYLPQAAQQSWIREGTFSVRYLDYDWALNDRK